METIKFLFLSIFFCLGMFLSWNSIVSAKTPAATLSARSPDGSVVVQLKDTPCAVKDITKQLKKEYKQRFKQSVLTVNGEKKMDTCWMAMAPYVVIVNADQEQVMIPMDEFSPSDEI